MGFFYLLTVTRGSFTLEYYLTLFLIAFGLMQLFTFLWKTYFVEKDSGGWTFQWNFYAGGIFQNSYTIFCLFVLLSLCHFNFTMGFSTGWFLHWDFLQNKFYWRNLSRGYLSPKGWEIISGRTFHGMENFRHYFKNNQHLVFSK